MGSAPQPPQPVGPLQSSNPSLLLVDADVLLQLLIAEQLRLLGYLKREFGVQPAIAEAVEMEIRKSTKFRSRFTGVLEKALDSQTIITIDTRTLPAFVSTNPAAVYDSIQSVGLKYERSGLDYGEAYTFAAGVVLNAPVLSNDSSAIRTAQRKGLKLPFLVARVFDLVVLCRQCDYLDDHGCDDIRKALASEGEFIPAAFHHRSFKDGIIEFYSRIIDAALPLLGCEQPQSELDIRLKLARQSRTPGPATK